MQSGVFGINTSATGQKDLNISFGQTFSTAPKAVFAMMQARIGMNEIVSVSNITTSGFIARVNILQAGGTAPAAWLAVW